MGICMTKLEIDIVVDDLSYGCPGIKTSTRPVAHGE